MNFFDNCFPNEIVEPKINLLENDEFLPMFKQSLTTELLLELWKSYSIRPHVFDKGMSRGESSEVVVAAYERKESRMIRIVGDFAYDSTWRDSVFSHSHKVGQDIFQVLKTDGSLSSGKPFIIHNGQSDYSGDIKKYCLNQNYTHLIVTSFSDSCVGVGVLRKEDAVPYFHPARKKNSQQIVAKIPNKVFSEKGILVFKGFPRLPSKVRDLADEIYKKRRMQEYEDYISIADSVGYEHI